MRETNLNQPINRTEVKVGDKIRVSREITVTSVRETTIHEGVGKPRQPITIVGTANDSIGLTKSEAVTLLERDREAVKIPTTAEFIYWQDEGGDDYYARHDAEADEWVEDDGDTYTTEKLVAYIEHDLKPGSFQVLKHKRGFASGGQIRLSDEALASLRNNLLPRNAVINPRIGSL